MNQIVPALPLASVYLTPVEGDGRTARRLLVVEDGSALTEELAEICDFLGIGLDQVSSYNDLTPILADLRPMGIVAIMDSPGQDGCHVLKTVAAYDQDLPIILITGCDAAMADAAQAVEEVWGLSSVQKAPCLPSMGKLAEFLCQAGLRGNCLGLMPA